MADTKLCQAVGCTRVARHQWRIGDRDCFLCSECKLAVQTPWLKTPELEPEGETAGADHSGDAKHHGAALRAVPPLPEVDGDRGPGEVPVHPLHRSGRAGDRKHDNPRGE